MSLARVRAIAVLGTLILVAAGIATWAIFKDTQGSEAKERDCPPGAVPAATALPKESDVTVNVLNAGDQDGLAGQVAGTLRRRGFKTATVDNVKRSLAAPAEIWYGPKGVGAAHLMTSQLLDAKLVFDLKRKDATIDLLLGNSFRQLNTPTEVKQAIRTLGDPKLPPGTC